jgi:hypothetical protein
MGRDPWGFWGAAVEFPGLALLPAVSAIGERPKAHQMEELKERVDSLVGGLEDPRGAGRSPERDQSPRT